MKSKNVIFNIGVLLFITFCVQFTDLKIGYVKIAELLLLAITPVVFLWRLNKYIIYLFVFFSLMALISLVTTSGLEFNYMIPSFFKRPYWITLSRYLEIVTCLILCNICYLYFRSLKKTREFEYYINLFIDINLAITLIFVLVYVLVVFGLISMNDTRLVYSYATRLRGYYAEGGPLGLMLSFFFILCRWIPNISKRIVVRVFLFIVITFMAQSKAGIFGCLVWTAIENFRFTVYKLKRFLLPLIAIASIVFIYLFININKMYVDEFERVRRAVLERPRDRNLILGRVSGFFIAPKMIMENPILGIGTGNYPLLRNNKEYRGFFPLPPEDIRNIDAHGYGGIIDILVDNGLIGLTLFFLIMGVIFLKVRNVRGSPELLLGFIVLFLFGVQIHFMYPWVLLALVLSSTSYDEVGSGSQIDS